MTVTFDFEGTPAPVRDAATVIVLRDGENGADPEIFFVRRHADARFMGGAYVFPGGRLDPGDAAPEVPADLSADEAAKRLGLDDSQRSRALFVAAARECLEESGILLSSDVVSDDALRALRAALAPRGAPPITEVLAPYGITLALSSLVPFARWITPKIETRRFDATFFLARAPRGSSLATHDGSETVASVWLSAREALARAARREIVLAPPTWRVLDVLSHARSVDGAFVLAPSAPLDPVEPVVTSIDGAVTVILPDDRDFPISLRAAAPPRMASVQLGPMPARFVYDDGVWIPSE